MTSPREASSKALLALLAPQAPASGDARIADPERWDWDWLIERAAAHKVISLLAVRLLDHGYLDAVPESLRARVTDAPGNATQRNQMAVHTLRVATEALDGAGVRALVLKGSLLVERVYGDPRLRRFHDVDLVVQPAAVARAEQALTDLSYRLWGVDELMGMRPDGADEKALMETICRRLMPRYYHQLALIPRDRELLPIDLHWHISPPGRIHVVGTEAWNYSVADRVAGVDVHVLDREAMLLHLAVHALSSWPWGFRLLHLCDLAWAVTRIEVDGERLQRLAKKWGATRQAAAALSAARAAFGIEIPGAVAAWIDPISGAAAQRILSPAAIIDGLARPVQQGWRRARADVQWTLALSLTRANLTFLMGKWLGRTQFEIQRRLRSSRRDREQSRTS